MAFEWLRTQLGTQVHHISAYEHGVAAACGVLNRPQRSELLGLLTRKNYSDDIFDMLLGDDTDLFAEWLNRQVDESIRFQPLARDANPRWIEMARLALDAGATPEELAEYCLPDLWHGESNLSDQFAKRIPEYEALAKHNDVRFRPAGRKGLAFLQRELARQLDQERREDR